MTLKYIWRSFQPRLSFPRPFLQSFACYRVARFPSNSWASCPPLQFVLRFSVLAYSIPRYLPFPYLHFQSPRHKLWRRHLRVALYSIVNNLLPAARGYFHGIYEYVMYDVTCSGKIHCYLRIRAARGRESVYVLQMFFFCFFPSATTRCINMRQPFSGTAERIFMKLLPNDRGNGVSNAVPKWGLGPRIIFGG